MSLLTILIIVLAGGAALAYPYFLNNYEKEKSRKNSAKCQQIMKESTELLDQNKNQEAYDKLKTQAENCAKVNATTAKHPEAETSREKVRALQFNADLAKAAIKTHDYKQARSYSARVLAANGNMTADERSKIPDYNGIMFEMLAIGSGFSSEQNPKESPR